MPFGPFSDFQDCLDTMMEKYDEESAKNVCGAMQRDLGGSLKGASKQEVFKLLDGKKVLTFEQNGQLFIKSFLIDGSVNYNGWGVTADSIPRNIKTAIGKPIVLSADFDHPYLDDKDYSHALQYQDLFKVAEIVDVVPRQNGTWEQIARVTNEGFAKALREDPNLPFWVSPTIRLLGSQPDDAISEWELMHEAIVDAPAYGIKKAMINGQCSGDSATCLLHLRKAHIDKFGYGSCGFCTYKQMKKLSSSSISSRKNSNEKILQQNIMSGNTTENTESTNSSSNVGSTQAGEGGTANSSTTSEQQVTTVTEEQQTPQNTIAVGEPAPGSHDKGNKGRGKSGDPSHGRGQEQREVSQQRKEIQKQLIEQRKIKHPNFARDQEVGAKPEGTSEEDFEQFKQRRMRERAFLDQEEGRNASVDDLLLRLEFEQQKNAKLEQLLSAEQASKDSIADVCQNLTARLEVLESERKEQLDRQRYTEIANIVNASMAYREVPPDQKKAQIEKFHQSTLSLDDIRGIINPIEASFRKSASLQYGTAGNTGYRVSRLQLGGSYYNNNSNTKAVETKAAAIVNNSSSGNNNEPFDSKPAGLGFAEMLLGRKGVEY